MAPKAKSKAAGSLAPKILNQDFNILVGDVSIESDSGWRKLDGDRVDTLVKKFLAGEWGVNIMTKPSVLSEHGQAKMAQNGSRMLCDGKHTFAALQACKQKWEAMGEDPDADETIVWTDRLIDAFTSGVSVNVYEFDDMAKMKAYCVAAHDEASNTYKPTSVHDLWELVHDYKKTVPGGDWRKTQEKLYQVYGQKSMFVYRMMQVAMTLPEDVCEKAGDLNIPNSYLNENNYFLGHGAEASKRMGTEFRKKALDMLAEDRTLGRGLSPKVFQEEYCAPLHKAERWITVTKRQFGTHADNPAFRRVEEFLGSSRARLSILACLKTNLPLHGVSEEQPGIEQCRVLVKDLEAALQGKRENAGDGLGAAGQGNAAQGQTGNGLGAAASGSAAGSGAHVADAGDMMIGMEEEADPIATVVQGKVEAALMKINYYQTYEQLEKVLLGVAMATHKVIFIVDAPSSKSRVVVNLIDWTVKLLGQLPCASQSRVLIPVGSRTDLLSSAEVRATTSLPDMHHFCIQLNSGDEQKVRKKAAFMHLACHPKLLAEGRVPCSIPAQSARAQVGECTRLRCLDSQCPLRTQDEKSNLQRLGDPSGIPNNMEIDADDREAENVDEHMQDDATKDPIDDMLAQLLPPSGRRDCIVDLWPFAFGQEYYKAIFDAIVPNESIDHVVVMTTSAHPSIALASHDRRMNVHILLDRVKGHSRLHGDKVLKGWLTRVHDAAERQKVDPSKKRLRSEDLLFVPIPAPELQPVHFIDVPSDANISAWRAGMDTIPDPQVLEKGILDLVAKELADHCLSVAVRKGRHVLVTNRALKEGATICPVSSLLFSKPELVRDFLNTSFHSALTDSPLLTIEGLDTMAARRSMKVHAILVGAARLVTDFRGFRKWANCSFRVSPHEGANDNFLSLVVQTHNGCGVAAGTEIMADLGEGYVPGAVADKPPSKKFKGALDALFEQQRAEDTGAEASANGGNGLDAAKGAGGNGLDAAKGAAGAGAKAAGAAAGSAAGAKAAGAAAGSAAGAAAGAGATAAGSASAAGGAHGTSAEGGGSATGAGSAAAGSAAAGAGEGAAGASATGEVLGKYSGVTVSFKDGQVAFHNVGKSNVKIPPHTVVMSIEAGRLTEANSAREHLDIPFAPTPKTMVFLKTGAQTSTITSLADIIRQHGCSALYQHHGFPKGSPPANFNAKKKTVMAPTREDVAKALMEALKQSTKFHWVWIVEVQGGGKIMPVGAAVSNKKQTIIKAGAVEPL